MKIYYILFIILILIVQQAASQHSISHHVFGSGGNIASNDQYALAGTVGQPLMGIASNDTNQVTGGFWHLLTDIPVAIESLPDLIPVEYRLNQNYPNPFNPTTTIRYSLPTQSKVKIEVFNTIGQQVALLVDDQKNAGFHSVKWDARNNPSGMYFYRIVTENFVKIRKMLLMK